MTQLRLSGKGAGGVFIVQREDADIVRPNDRTDLDFGNALREAKRVGVDITAYVCKVDIEQRSIDIVCEIPITLENIDG